MTKCLTGIILNREDRAENFISFTLFSPELGICYVMQKISKSRHNPLPDFFSEVSLECNQGSLPNYFFIKSANYIESLNAFAKNYKGLQACSKLSQCIISNAKHLEEFSSLYDSFFKAIQAYSPQINPLIINIKWLYKFAKQEGYAIREDFAMGLSEYYFKAFVELINTASVKVSLGDADIDYIYNKLSLWVNSSTDIIY